MKRMRIEDAKGVEMGSAIPAGLLPPSSIRPSTQWERRQWREKLRMGHKSHQAPVQLEYASTSPPPPPSPPERDSAQKLTTLKKARYLGARGSG
ncbi:unnamed protein product [Leuciscus chuanchicus]